MRDACIRRFAMIAQEGTRAVLADQVFVFRTIDLDADVARLVRMYNEIQAADGLGAPTSEAEQRGALTRPTVDLARDRWVVEAPGDPDRLIAEGGAGKAG